MFVKLFFLRSSLTFGLVDWQNQNIEKVLKICGIRVIFIKLKSTINPVKEIIVSAGEDSPINSATKLKIRSTNFFVILVSFTVYAD